MLFGRKNVVGGLPARKSNKFSAEAKAVMQWSKTVYENQKDVVPGMTPNTISAALPELALILASQQGSTGRPLPALLQLPLEASLRDSLHEHICKKLNPEGTTSEAARVAEELQKRHPLTTMHCLDAGNGTCKIGS